MVNQQNQKKKLNMNSPAWSNELNNDEFRVGDLVWVRRRNYSFWPCIVSIDPDLKKHYKKLDDQHKYYIYVHYFNAEEQIKWTTNLEFFSGNDTILYKYPKYLSFKKKGGEKMNSWNLAVKEANSLLKFDRKERWIKFSNKNEMKSLPTSSSIPYSSSSATSSNDPPNCTITGEVCHTCKISVIDINTHICCPATSSNTLEHNQSNSKVDNDMDPVENVSIDQIKLSEIFDKFNSLWNQKLSLDEQSETVKSNLWNMVDFHFDGQCSKLEIQEMLNTRMKEKYSQEKNLPPSGSMGDKKKRTSCKNIEHELSVTQKCTTKRLADESAETGQFKKQKKSEIAENVSTENVSLVLVGEIKNNETIPPTAPKTLNQKFASYLAELLDHLSEEQSIKFQKELITYVMNKLK